ncbi:MAG: DEAD/DEAH box helicase family protein [Bacteroidetes bacterium]|nr:DEAD/DEAH box helicase family protein [Bacteroidota bacterium]
MKKYNLDKPYDIAVKPLILNSFKEKGNEQIWLEHGSSKLSISIIEEYRGRVDIIDTSGKRYVVVPKNSKKSFSEDILEADLKKQKEILPAFLDRTIILQWKKHNNHLTQSKLADNKNADAAIISLQENTSLHNEVLNEDGSIKVNGLRAPQIGAIYSILSNWAISNEDISVVLPTGTGKSESILGTIISKKISHSLIVVPSDGLRNQFYSNCQSWGILRDIGIVKPDALNPIVCRIGTSPKKEDDLIKMIVGSNLIIATASILHKLNSKVLSVINENCEAIFIDEAHHSSAPTWEILKSNFKKPKIIQFTATPFREDGKPVNGKIVFNYPLEEAQKNKFFTKIDFIPVIDYDEDNWDKTISEKAIEILRKDISDGHNHLLMARVDNIAKAESIFKKYYEQYTEFNPILITSKSTATNALIDKLRKGESRIVVCVNMLGEGIDIPQLKIAALHDIRKSLTITLQFIGRFTRSNKSTSPAKIIANIADVKIEKKLKQLYKEDADWGKLIAFASAKEIQKKIKFQELLSNFKHSKIPLFNLKPKLSTVVYKATENKWYPEEIEKYLDKHEELYLCDINVNDNLAIAIYQVEENIDWLDSKVFVENSWELLLIYFDEERQLLYVNSSIKNVDYNLVSQLIKVDFRFEREAPFKCYHGLGHVVLFTLGVDKNTDSPIKYAMYAGTDIMDGISDMEKNKSSKSNTYGSGFNNGEEITLGASKHGKIWSRLIGNVQEWKEWCDSVGDKLLDSTINVTDIFKGFLQPKRFNIDDFPTLRNPISIDFPTQFYQENESTQWLIIDGLEIDMDDISLYISPNTDGYKIQIMHSAGSAYLNIVFTDDSFQYVPENFKTIEYKKRKKVVDFIEYLKTEDAFKIRLLDGTFTENNYHFKPFAEEAIFPIDTTLLSESTWTGVDLSVESMGLSQPLLTNSIQYKIYQDKLTSGSFSIIINDDSAGEAADLLCFGVRGDQLIIEAIHCKYKLQKDPLGSRTKDFYELCCQAQKTIKNFSNILRLFDHIKGREAKSVKGGNTRFLKGTLKDLEIMIKGNSFKRPQIKVILVQPGLLKTKASKDVLELLGSTCTLLKETINADFEVICS